MIRSIFLLMIKGYKKFISPFLGNHCRFYPTCGNYTYMAIERFGVVKGLILGIIRILKCHPWHPGGCDPVPNKFKVSVKWIQKDLL